jgi:cell division protein FtsL
MSLTGAPELSKKVSMSWYLLVSIVAVACIVTAVIVRQVDADRYFQKEVDRLEHKINVNKKRPEEAIDIHEQIHHGKE